jgi:uncharacterized protein (TIGR02284 family)
MDHDGVVDILNRLIAVCQDSEDFFRSAARRISDRRLNELFSEVAEKRSSSVAALSGLVSSRTDEATRRGTVAGDAHRVYAELEALVVSNDVATLVRRLRQAEHGTVDEFGKALALDLPLEARAVVEHQHCVIRGTFGHLDALQRVAL